ncbi:MAG: hypothetical protein CMM01_22490 [Rhodopirellula sp.]|nr:hypothetical protein [Rhodopirellula sp.]OUX49399.1 MAG: hypothetical protein CBE43_10225 [Rhodopirellula sp. TMED283]
MTKNGRPFGHSDCTIHTAGSGIVQVVTIKTTKQPREFTFNTLPADGRFHPADTEPTTQRSSLRCNVSAWSELFPPVW